MGRWLWGVMTTGGKAGSWDLAGTVLKVRIRGLDVVLSGRPLLRKLTRRPTAQPQMWTGLMGS